jgi:hypothetical protein
MQYSGKNPLASTRWYQNFPSDTLFSTRTALVSRFQPTPKSPTRLSRESYVRATWMGRPSVATVRSSNVRANTPTFMFLSTTTLIDVLAVPALLVDMSRTA